MSSIRVIAGTLRGRVIPFSVKRFGNADITPQKLKEAFFAIIGGLEGKVFLDLFACSGQMGIEALSRGASCVVMNDADAKRYRFIREQVDAIGEKTRAMVLHGRYRRALSILKARNMAPDVIYADPPYPVHSEADEYGRLLGRIAESGVLNSGGVIALQHRTGAVMKETPGGYALTDTRAYGSNALSFYTAGTA